MSQIDARQGRRRSSDAIGRRGRRRFRPAVTALEGRALLATLTVSSTADGDGPNTLRWAIAQANANNQADTIEFSSAFNTPQTITLTNGVLQLTDASTTTIEGPGAALLTVNGNSSGGVFEVVDGSAALSGLTVTGGQALRGAGVLNNGGTLAMSGVTVTNNSAADRGGGVATLFDGATTLTNCTIKDNSAQTAGGGVDNFYQGSATLTNCTITGNSAPTGGGLSTEGGSLTLTQCTVSKNSGQLGAGLANQSSATTSLTNCTVSGNTATGNGGGLASNSGTLSLANCTVSDNSAKYGGGLANLATGTATVTDGTIAHNTAGMDGGGAFNTGTSLSLTGVTVRNNSTSRYAGGVFNSVGSTTLEDCTVTGNSATGLVANGGGVVARYGARLDLTDCTVSGNTAQFGAGMLVESMTTVLTNCTLSGNQSGNTAGAMFLGPSATTTLVNCTVAGNGATFFTGGIYMAKDGNPTLSLTNVIISGNSNDDVSGSFTGSNNLIGGDNLLSPLGNYGGSTPTIGLLPGSPAIAAGTSAGAPQKDQRGVARGSRVDVGAFQSQGFTLTPAAGSTPQSASAGSAFANPLTVVVTANDPDEPVNGGVVQYTVVPAAGGATATLAAATATVANGQAGVAATANVTLGSYTVTVATVGAAGPATFNLTNTQTYSLVVNTTGDLPLLTNGQNSLRAAIAYANTFTTPSVITFDPSVFGKSARTIHLSNGQLTLTNTANVTIQGPGAALLTVGGASQANVFDIENGSAAISGLTVTGGDPIAVSSALGNGGGVYINGGNLTLTGCTITGNTAGDGGGLYNLSGTVTLTGCTLSDNTAGFGGGLFNLLGTVSMTNCTITGNTSGGGGGVWNDSGSMTLTGCTLSDNTAGVKGGGLTNFGGTTSMTNDTLTGNSAGMGGGIFGATGSITLTGCTVTGNSASHVNQYPADLSGGGFYLNAGRVSLAGCTVFANTAKNGGGFRATSGVTLGLTNCTVIGNIATATGGGLTADQAAAATLTNCTVFSNSAPAGSGVYVSGVNQSGTLSVTNTIVASNTSGPDISGNYTGAHNLIGGNPMLIALGDYGGPTLTMAPQPGSPVIGAGTGSGAPATDQRGLARGTAVDIGAFQTGALVVNGTTDSNVTASGVLSLRQAVNLANALSSADEITFDPTVFGSAQTITLTAGELALTDKATTTILGDASVNGAGRSRVFDVQGGSASLIGLTITGGSANGGGGVLNNGGTLSLLNAVINGNYGGGSGGGVATQNGGVTSMTTCTVSNNTVSASDGSFSGNGGGVFASDSTLTLDTCTITDNNSTYYGAGVCNLRGSTTLENCTVSGNSTSVSGSGLYNGYGAMTVSDCAIINNTGGNSGGGITSGQETTTTLTNCTISGNTARTGGGVYVHLGTYGTTVTNCTITGNTAPASAGGLYFAGNDIWLTLTNVLAAGNSNGDVVSGFGYQGSNNLIGGNPLLSALGQYGGFTPNFALLPGSPAIAAGTTNGAPNADQRKLPRAGHIDIGAFQSQGFTLTPVTDSTPQSAEVGKAFAHPLAVTVTPAFSLEPVDGGVIQFNAPGAGASATLSATSAGVSGGQAAVTATANTATGQYSVSAGAAGAGSTNFALANTEAASLVLPTTRDVVDQFDGLTSLREAIAYANAHPGPDTIVLAPAARGTRTRTITLNGGPLVLTDPATTTIIGPGANRLTISGAGRGRVFDVRGGSLALSGLTITGGRADDGGGIRNDGGRLVLTGVALRGNSARILGGGLFNDGTATLRHVTVTGNTASGGGGIANFGTLSLAHVTHRANHARFASALFSGRTARLIKRWWPIREPRGNPPVVASVDPTEAG